MLYNPRNYLLPKRESSGGLHKLNASLLWLCQLEREG